MLGIDLNIQNYTKNEIEGLFNLGSKKYNEETIDTNLKKIEGNIIANNNVDVDTKNKSIQFLYKAKNVLINFIEGNHETQYDGAYNLHEHANHFVMKKNLSSVNPNDPLAVNKAVNIDTIFRDNLTNSSSTNFQISLPFRLTNCTKVNLTNIELDNNFINISEKLGNNYFHYQFEGGALTKFSIADGIYNNGSDLTDAINVVVNNLSHIVSPTNKIKLDLSKIQTGKDVTIYFNLTKDGAPCENDNRLLQQKLGWIMGFRKESYTLKSSDLNLTSESSYNLKLHSYVFLLMDDFQNNVGENIINSSNDYINSKNILSRISFQENVQSSTNIDSPFRHYYGPTNIQKLKFQLVDKFGRNIDNINNDFSFSLHFVTNYD